MPAGLTPDIITVFAVIAIVVFLFIVEWIRIDVVAILVMVSLPILGLVDGKEAFDGLASNAVVSIIAIIIIGRGLDHTGVISRVVRPIVNLAGNNRSRIVAMLSITIAFISSIMQNIGAAALFLPAIRRIGNQSGLPLSRLLMPIGFSAILGGTITLVGSSPLIMLNDLIADFGLQPFGLFSVTPIGIALVATGITYFILTGSLLLRDKSPSDGKDGRSGISEAERYENIAELFELAVPKYLDSLFTVRDLTERYMIHVVGMVDGKDRENPTTPDIDATITPGSIIAVYGPLHRIELAAERLNLVMRQKGGTLSEWLSKEVAGVVEAVVPPSSQLIGKSVADVRFRHHHLVVPLALIRTDRVWYTDFSEQELQMGDALLMYGRWEFFQKIYHDRDLLFTQTVEREILEPRKAGTAVLCFLLATAMVIFSGQKLSVCLMTGALGMILGGVLTIDEAYHGIDWRTVFLLAGLMPLGVATQQSGAAQWMANGILGLLGQPSQVLLLLVIGAMSTIFTLVVSNVGATILLVPLVVNLAQNSGADPRLAALVVALAASNSFLLPTHQVNALYMGPGGYRSVDFLKAGAPLSIIFLIVLVAMLQFFYA